jgi:site-specific recombinase
LSDAPVTDLSFYSFFTRYSLLDNYGFLNGLSTRILRNILPDVPPENTFEHLIVKSRSKRGNFEAAKDYLDKVLDSQSGSQKIANELDRAILALATKISAYGLDHQFQTIFTRLGINSDCFSDLLNDCDQSTQSEGPPLDKVRQELEAVTHSIRQIRKNKNIIGTSLHLTITTRRILSYVVQTSTLLDLRHDPSARDKWEQLIYEWANHYRSEKSIRKYVGGHVDLLALEIVEHTSEKGEHYVAGDQAEYWKFFRKGLLGGAVIALFALGKILLDKVADDPLPSALVFSINYALCFIVVKFIGGTIATKQPAMTASTIIRHIDKNDNLELGDTEDILELLRKVGRSQFISLIGNFLMASSVGCLLALSIDALGWADPIDEEKALYLIKQVQPIAGGALFYAAIAGIFLAASGLISGYFDNRVIASGVPHRIIHNGLLSRLMSEEKRKSFAAFIKKYSGVLAGNISLGFLLGCAFLASYLLPFSVDIRHIAFSSANVGFAAVNYAFGWSTVGFALVAVLLIGLVNFAVSFSITFFLALKSRRVTTRGLGELVVKSVKDFVTNPLPYLFYRSESPK